MFTDAMNTHFLGCAQWWRNESPDGSPAFRQQVVGTFSKRLARKNHSLRNRKFLEEQTTRTRNRGHVSTSGYVL